MEGDLGNVGVQREVVSYEKTEGFIDPEPTWLAILSCGHAVKLSAPPQMIGTATSGRLMDCERCTLLARAQS